MTFWLIELGLMEITSYMYKDLWYFFSWKYIITCTGA